MHEPTTAQRDEHGPQLTEHGGAAEADHDREVPEIDLLRDLAIRGITLRNRIVLPAMPMRL